MAIENSHQDDGVKFDLGADEFQEMDYDDSDSLTWTQPPDDPSDVLSDWTVVVHHAASVDECDEGETYYVHKSILGVGSKKSQYFSRLFRSQHGLKETETSTTIVTLETSAAKAFPVMLDFLYSPTDELNANTNNAVALRFLARYFGMRKLFHEINEFIQSDLAEANATVYLAEASMYHDEKVVNLSCKLCAEKFCHLAIDNINSLSPDLLNQVISSSKLKCGSRELSIRVADYCRANAESIDGNFLRLVTDPLKMPRISPKEALFMLRLSSSHLSDHDESIGTCDIIECATLQQRCIAACSKEWNGLVGTILKDKESDSDVPCDHFEHYADLPLQAKVDLLESALVAAKEDHSRVLSHKSSIEHEMNVLQKKMRSMQVEKDAMSQACQSELQKLREKILLSPSSTKSPSTFEMREF